MGVMVEQDLGGQAAPSVVDTEEQRDRSIAHGSAFEAETTGDTPASLVGVGITMGYRSLSSA
jgi:hypothetical protein